MRISTRGRYSTGLSSSHSNRSRCGGSERIKVDTRLPDETFKDRFDIVQSLVEEQSLADLISVLRQQLAADAEFAALGQFDDWVDLNITGIHAQIARMEGVMDG